MKEIILDDGTVINTDSPLYIFAKETSDAELSKLITKLSNAIYKMASNERQKMMIRKLDRGITKMERKLKIGDYAAGVRKGLIGQDDFGDERLWPSVDEIL